VSFLELFSPDFLLRHALWGAVAVGVFCPLVGAWFTVRRMVLLGLTLPQVSAAGISFVFFLEGMGLGWSLHAGEEGDRFLALLGSLAFVFAAMGALAWLERRADGLKESRLGALYAAAAAGAILLVSANAEGRVELLGLLHGEVVSVTAHDLHILLGAFLALGALLALLHRQFLLIAFDRESAAVLGKNTLLWDLIFYGIAGLALSMSVLITGPLLTFGALVIPPLAARPFCRRMPAFLTLSSAFGGAAALLGFWFSYAEDLPLGPAVVALAAGASLLLHLGQSLVLRLRRS
jgi:zinc/manganese transport system permease protein